MTMTVSVFLLYDPVLLSLFSPSPSLLRGIIKSSISSLTDRENFTPLYTLKRTRHYCRRRDTESGILTFVETLLIYVKVPQKCIHVTTMRFSLSFHFNNPLSHYFVLLFTLGHVPNNWYFGPVSTKDESVRVKTRWRHKFFYRSESHHTSLVEPVDPLHLPSRSTTTTDVRLSDAKWETKQCQSSVWSFPIFSSCFYYNFEYTLTL